MTINELAKKTHVDYSLIYQALAYKGLLIRGEKNVQYNEADMFEAIHEYVEYRNDKIMHKMGNLNWSEMQIDKFARKMSQKQG